MLTREETIDTRNPDQLKQEDPFNVPIPGQSLTSSSDTERVKQPPEESNPEKVLAFAMKRLKSPDVKEKMLDLLLSGLPVELLVKNVTKAGFLEGKYSPDVAELITPALTIFMIDMARKEDIPVKVFMDEGVSPEQQAEEDQKLARVMEEQRPELASGIRAVKFQDQLKDRSAKASSAMAAREKINEKEMPVESDGSFLELGE
jgi:antitoxin component of RelBE/YafQ-DinJ toxin-antitoxin module